MLIYSLNFLLGIVVFSLKNTLTISNFEWGVIFTILFAIFITFKRYKTYSINMVIFLLGFAWMGVFSAYILKSQVSTVYLNTPINIIGTISDLPKISNHKATFIFKVEQPFNAKVKLSWYGKNLPALQVNNQWHLRVTLKRNNGYQNLGGFDYEQWLFYKQINATGYVKSNINNTLINPNSSLSINKFRQNIKQTLSKFLNKLQFGGVLNALVIGDRTLISEHNWTLFKATNTTHLSVISGLHIGLISGFIFLFTGFLWRQCMKCTLRIPALIMGSYFGLMSALIYALIAGFSIPTQRAFIMASVVFLSIIFRRYHAIWQLYGMALLLVLIINPVSIFSVGFWLSFYVVAIIIYGTSQHKNKHWIVWLIYIQLLISLATMPLIAWFFNSGSILSPLANLVAIPVFSFISTPFALVGAIFAHLQLSLLATLSFDIANQSLVILSILLEYLQNFNFNQWYYTQASSAEMLLLIIATLIAILPSALKLRKIALILLLLVVFHPLEKITKGSAIVTILDVGQGLANVIRTQNHTLLFDTGSGYPSGFNMGDAVIIPYLRSKQIQYLDKIIISHGDNDHIGGLNPILKAFNVLEIHTSVPNKIKATTTLCKKGQYWIWDDVLFEILNPDDNFKDNNASCVLKISTHSHSILLSADIEKKTEKYLISNQKNKLPSNILISPHHGSKTSSSDKFLDVVSPKWVVISSGYKNRFNHPAKVVVNRYKNHSINILNTSCAGQIEIFLDKDIVINQYRQDYARYYQRQCDVILKK